MSPALYLAGVVILIGALGWSILTIARTVIPAMPKVRDALAGRGGRLL